MVKYWTSCAPFCTAHRSVRTWRSFVWSLFGLCYQNRYFYRLPTKLPEGYVFNRVCPMWSLPVMPLVLPLFAPWDRSHRIPLYGAKFKLVQFGPHHTGIPKICSNLFTMKHELSERGQLAFNWNAFLFWLRSCLTFLFLTVSLDRTPWTP